MDPNMILSAPMDARAFAVELDRYGCDLSRWPTGRAALARKLLVHSEEARLAYDRLARVEALIADSRPFIVAGSAQRVIDRALAAVAEREAAPPLLQRILALIAAPLPRAAFAMSLTGVGFAIGLAVGNPTTDRAFDAQASGFPVTSADDVLF